MGGSRLSVCKLSALGQSCQLSVTLDWHFLFNAQAGFGIKEYRTSRKAGMRRLQ